MPNIRMMDMNFLDDLFDMRGGYVLDFSNRTFSMFFQELNINIDDSKWDADGTSKGKRLRFFLQTTDTTNAARVLRALWEYRQDLLRRSGKAEAIPDALDRFNEVIARLTGEAPKATTEKTAPTKKYEPKVFADFASEFMSVAMLDAQPRGYAFEKFLKKIFDAFGLKAKDAFRIRGEQIDGSFELGNAVYLLEARWQNAQSNAGDLHSFHGKVDQKAAWTRGLFVSFNGFTEDGLSAFGRGKKVICMDGLDLSEALDRKLPLDEVIDRKVRRASETGAPFIRVRDLY